LSAATPTNQDWLLVWAKADYGVTPTVINYKCEINRMNFDTPVVLTSSTNLFLKFPRIVK
jgi:hypothetical protein